MIELIFNNEINDAFCCNFSRLQVFPINILINLELHSTNVTSCHLSATVELKIRIDICFTSVASQWTVNVHCCHLFRSKWRNPGTQWEDRLFWCVVYHYACRTNELRSCIVIVFAVKKLLRSWKRGKTLSEPAFLINCDLIVRREQRSRHWSIFTFINLLINSSWCICHLCDRLLLLRLFILLRIHVMLLIQMSQAMSHRWFYY